MTETFPARAEFGPGPARSAAAAVLSRSRHGRRSTGSGNWSWRVLGPVAFVRLSRRAELDSPAGCGRLHPRGRRPGQGAGRGRCAQRLAEPLSPTASPSRPCPSPPRRAVRSPPKPSRRPSRPACPMGPWSSTRARPRRWATSRRRRPPRGTRSSATWAERSAGDTGRGRRGDRRPERPVVALQADGSGLYAVQALWTQARENLDITTVVCANHGYRILQVELARAGRGQLGPAAAALTDLSDPRIDWVSLAGGLGVPARAARGTSEELTAGLEWALAESGPHLLQATL